MLLKDLQKMGFPKNLATVYLALFEIGEGKAGEIIRKTGLHRNIVYGCLEKLEEKTLITKVEFRGVAIYKTLHPDRILNELKDREQLVKNIVDELSRIRRPTTQEVIIHEGEESIRESYFRVYSNLISKDEICLIGLSTSWYDVMGEKAVEKLKRMQREKNIRLKGVGDKIDFNEAKFQSDMFPLVEMRVVPGLEARTNEMVIFSDRLFISILVKPYTVVEIINPEIVKVYKQQFEIFWNQEVKTYRGWDQIQDMFYSELLPMYRPNVSEYCIGGGYGEGGDDSRVEEFYIAFNTARIQKGGHMKVLFYEQHREKAIREMQRSGDAELRYTELKFLPAAHYSPLQIMLVGGKTALIYWGETPTATLYSRPAIYESYKKQFDLLWKQEVQTYSGWQEINELFLQYLTETVEKGDVECVIGAGYGDEKTGDLVSRLFLRHNGSLMKKGVFKRALFYEQHRDHFENETRALNPERYDKYIKVRYLPKEFYFSLETHIFKNKATITYFGENPVSTLYQNPNIIAGFQRQFDFLWSISKE